VKLISWNIQSCRGMDGRVDPARIAGVAQALADPDLCCFQEVEGESQAEALARAFPGYDAFAAWAVDAPAANGGRLRFGNLILSRLPVGRVMRHSLPWPAQADSPSMPRVALEATVRAPWGWVRVTTTHLEFYGAAQRAAQAARLAELDDEARAHAAARPSDRYREGPFAPQPRAAEGIVTGDFNMKPGDAAFAPLRRAHVDAWDAANPGQPHPPSFFVHDRAAGIEPYCCDVVLVTRELAPRIESARVDGETQASDHQPVIVSLRD
jgi:endonuclease/exonuclease/phosphatase family metal-dependent hydrolase